MRPEDRMDRRHQGRPAGTGQFQLCRHAHGVHPAGQCRDPKQRHEARMGRPEPEIPQRAAGREIPPTRVPIALVVVTSLKTSLGNLPPYSRRACSRVNFSPQSSTPAENRKPKTENSFPPLTPPVSATALSGRQRPWPPAPAFPPAAPIQPLSSGRSEQSDDLIFRSTRHFRESRRLPSR